MSEKQETAVSLDVVKQLLAEQAKQNAENLAQVIAAVKAPNVVEQAELDHKMAEKEAAKKSREALAKGVLETIKDKQITQSLCTHEASDGHSHAVFVQEKSGPGYFICQKNQCKVRPGIRPTDRTNDSGAIYDTAQFNRLFQKQRSDII